MEGNLRRPPWQDWELLHVSLTSSLSVLSSALSRSSFLKDKIWRHSPLIWHAFVLHYYAAKYLLLCVSKLFLPFLVPTDGVKGKTWGPSSGGHVLSSLGNNAGVPKSRPSIPEERWSQSASNLEKSPKSKPGIPSVTSVPEMGKSWLSLLFWCVLVVIWWCDNFSHISL